MNIKEFLSYIKEAKSKATHKNYSQGLKKFIAWYGKDGNTILKERFEDFIRKLGDKRIAKEQEEYKKLIEENNNNNQK